MARTVKPWAGKTDDTRPPTSVQRRIVDRQCGICALTGRPFAPKDKIEFDHIVPLWLGGSNTEGNLQAAIGEAHKAKTKVEAGVRAKVNAAKDRHLGITAPKQKIHSKPFAKRPRPAPKHRPPARSLYGPGSGLMQPGTSKGD